MFSFCSVCVYNINFMLFLMVSFVLAVMVVLPHGYWFLLTHLHARYRPEGGAPAGSRDRASGQGVLKLTHLAFGRSMAAANLPTCPKN